MKIFRKRYIPNEIIDISGDEVIYRDEKLIVTRWLPIKPRKDISKGISYTMLDKGWKISKIFNQNGEFSHWYCDIIDYEYSEENNETYTLIDLLVDLVVKKDGSYEVLDLDELEDALKNNIITKNQYDTALKKLNGLIEVVKKGEFPPIKEID